MTPDAAGRARNRRTVWALVAVVAGMFGFGYALVPLYEAFCELTGINGRTGVITADAAAAQQVDDSRWITVEFTGTVMQGLPWEFSPRQSRIRVRPGAVSEAVYVARNTSTRRVTGQAVPSVAPAAAAPYFRKTECFCFTSQILEAGQSGELPVRFVVDAGLPRSVSTLTLSYSFFNVPDARGGS